MAIQLPDVTVRTANPLEPLSSEEVQRTSEILREQRGLDPQVRFVTVALHETLSSPLLSTCGATRPAPVREFALDSLTRHPAAG